MSEVHAAIAEARELGFKVWFDGEPTTDRAGNRVRCEVGRYLDDGIFYVVLFTDQDDDEAMRALEIAVRRLMAFDTEKWFVKINEDPPLVCVSLCDSAGTPMEDHHDVMRLMTA